MQKKQFIVLVTLFMGTLGFYYVQSTKKKIEKIQNPIRKYYKENNIKKCLEVLQTQNIKLDDFSSEEIYSLAKALEGYTFSKTYSAYNPTKQMYEAYLSTKTSCPKIINWQQISKKGFFDSEEDENKKRVVNLFITFKDAEKLQRFLNQTKLSKNAWKEIYDYAQGLGISENEIDIMKTKKTISTTPEKDARSCIDFLQKKSNVLRCTQDDEINQLAKNVENYIFSKIESKNAPTVKMFETYLKARSANPIEPNWNNFVKTKNQQKNKIKILNLFIIFRDISGLREFLYNIKMTKEEWEEVIEFMNKLYTAVIVDDNTAEIIKKMKEMDLKPWAMKQVKAPTKQYEFPWKKGK